MRWLRGNNFRTLSIIVCILAMSVFVFIIDHLHSFLALNNPLASETLVVEGWLFDYMLDAAVVEINRSNYKRIVTTGREKNFADNVLNSRFNSHAEYCKARLVERGVDGSKIIAIPSPSTKHHHTYRAAKAIAPWLLEKGITSVNVFTGGPHGRKSYHIFRKALDRRISVGVISCEIKHYDPEYWWISKRGFSVTTRYLIGYIYALAWPFDWF